MAGKKRGLKNPSMSCWQATVTADFSAAERPVDLTGCCRSRCFGAARHRPLPIPRQKLDQLGGWVIGDAAQHVGEPGLRVDVIELGGADQRIDGGGALAAAVGAG